MPRNYTFFGTHSQESCPPSPLRQTQASLVISSVFRSAMRLAILSDIHDQTGHLAQVLARLRPLEPEAVLLCGDITRVETLLAARLPGLPLAFCLFPALAAQAAATGNYKAVFYGHTHRRKVEAVETESGICLLVNPGDVE